MREKAVAAVLERINREQWTKAEVVERTGISFKTIDRLIEEGILPTRRDKRRQLALGLGLPADGIERLLAGEDIASVQTLERTDAPEERWIDASMLSEEDREAVKRIVEGLKQQR